MPRDIDGLLDDIDRLVDEQLAAGPVDDYNTNRYDKCWHCSRDWHGVAITQRVEQMRWSGRFDEDYRVVDDDSPVLCPGSDFIGPVQALSASGYSIRDFPHARERLSMRRDFPFYVTVDLDAVNRSFLTRHGFTIDEFESGGWRNIGHISDDGPVIRYWDANFNLVAGPQPPASPEEPSPPASAPSREPSTPRARERHQLVTRRQQQRDHIARTQRLVEQMHARIQELMQ